jgi:hypothetical protein
MDMAIPPYRARRAGGEGRGPVKAGRRKDVVVEEKEGQTEGQRLVDAFWQGCMMFIG